MVNYKIVLPRKEFHVIASVRKRILAFLIDFMIFFFFIMTPFLSIYYVTSGVPVDKITIDALMNNLTLFRIARIGDFATYAIFFFYLVSSEALTGSTVGKKLIGLSVINNSGRKPSLFQLIVRNLSKSLVVTMLPFDAMLMFFDSRHRRLLDYVSSTMVVENRKRIKRFPVVNEL